MYISMYMYDCIKTIVHTFIHECNIYNLSRSLSLSLSFSLSLLIYLFFKVI